MFQVTFQMMDVLVDHLRQCHATNFIMNTPALKSRLWQSPQNRRRHLAVLIEQTTSRHRVQLLNAWQPCERTLVVTN